MINFTKKKRNPESVLAMDPKCTACSCSPDCRMGTDEYAPRSTSIRDANIRVGGWVDITAQ